MTDKQISSRNQKQTSVRKKTGYTFPEAKIKHFGPYGVNEHPPALKEFEISQKNQNRQKRRQKEIERRQKQRKKLLIVFIVVLAIVLIAVGGIFAKLVLFRDIPDEKVVPVSTTNIPETENTDNLEEQPLEEAPVTETEAGIETDASDYDNSYSRVINRTYPIPEDFVSGTGKLTMIEGKQMETQAADALSRMVSALRATGMSIIIQSGYRTDGDQEYLYNRQIGRQNGNEYKAATISAVPLTSEHQAGLAVDLSIDGSLTENFATTEQGKWLRAHCAEYGYILRYPPGKEAVTGIIHEPWHFRFVGSAELATEIMISGKCMEEYFGKTLAPEDIDPYLDYLQ